jgi:Holliday junction resolvase RusA-like endonuclease
MAIYFLTLDIAPTPQSRPRFTRNGHIYDPCAKSKKELAHLIKKQWNREPIDKAVAVHFRFGMPIPKSTSKKKTKEMDGQPHIKKSADIDNLIKKLLDAMNGIVFVDDALVHHVSGSKYYSRDKPGIGIIVEA